MFRAYDPERERLVAIKLFKLDLPPEKVHQLVAALEALIASDVSHPAFAAPLATGITGVSAFLVQEYVGAESLDQAVREYGPAPVNDAVRVATQLAGALDFAAAASIVHGALHPRDILLSTDDTRMTGLGVARALAQAGVTAPVRRPYTAPERIDGGQWDRRADIFSLAALMFELMSGRRIAGTGADAVDGLGNITGADGPALRAAFARALDDDPDARFGTALEFAEALQQACSGEPVAAVVAAPPEPAAPEVNGPEVSAPEVRAPEVTAPKPVRKRVARKERPASVAAAAVETIEPVEPLEPVEPPALNDIDLHRAEETRYADAEVAPAFAPHIEPAIVEPLRPVVAEPAAYVPPVSVPAGLITGDPEPLTTFERSRSAVWPIVLALGVGVSVGFAAGYFTGAQARPAPQTATAPAGREFTEAAVPAPAAAATQQSQVASPKSQVESQATESSKVESRKSRVDSAKSQVPPTPPTRDSRPPTGDSRLATSDLRPATTASAAGPGRLLIRSTPAGAVVTVDGKDSGRTPATVRELAIGPHVVTVTRPGYAPADRRIVLTRARPAQSMSFALERGANGSTGPRGSNGSRGSAAASFAGGLTVDSRPSGARVYLDGKLVGNTPLSLQTVRAGEHAVRLERDGYKRWTSQVRIVASENNRVTASLER